MGKNSAIGWCNHTFNIVWGCTKIAPGCANCYAERESTRFGWDVWGPDKERRVLSDKYWREPLRWNTAAEVVGKKALVFCGSMCDWLEDHPTVNEQRARLWPLIKETPWLTWLLLTKRIENFEPMIINRSIDNAAAIGWKNLPRNIMLGISAGVQEIYDKKWPILQGLSAGMDIPTFVSLEPLLEPINLDICYNFYSQALLPDWIIVGGESGPKARPMKEEWVIDIIKQAGNTPVFVKQMGDHWHKRFKQLAWPPDKNFLPDTVRVQKFPQEARHD